MGAPWEAECGERRRRARGYHRRNQPELPTVSLYPDRYAGAFNLEQARAAGGMAVAAVRPRLTFFSFTLSRAFFGKHF